MGRHLSPRYGQVILVSGYPVLTVVNWSQYWCAISFLLGSQTTAVARKCESKHWFPCGTDGRPAGGRCTVTWLPNFLGWVGLLSYGAPRGAPLYFNIIKMHLTAISNIKKENIIVHEPKESKVKDSKIKKHFMLKTSWKFVKIHLQNEYGADLASSLSLRLCFKQVEYTKGEKKWMKKR